MNEIPEAKYARSGDRHIAYQVVGDGPFRGADVEHREGPGRRLRDRFEARGSHTLKGVPDEWLLFAVRN